MANNDAFAEFALSQVEDGRHFQPQVSYDQDGDCIEFLASNDMFYAERIDSLVTVYYSEDTGEIIGSLIKGVKKFIAEMSKKAPGFRIEIKDGKVRLEYLFNLKMWYAEEPRKEIVLAYRKLRDVAQRVDAEAELCFA